MHLIEIKDKNKLNDFIGSQERSELLQSWEWGEFQARAGAEVRRFGVEENGKLVAAATLIKRTLPLGTRYFYAPRGPIVDYDLPVVEGKLIDFLFFGIKEMMKKEKAIFLRVEPRKKINSQSFIIRNSLDIQVSKTIVLNLNKSEDELLAAMHQKTRYNIRLAEKKGVIVKESPLERGVARYSATGRVDFEKFWELMSATVNRDGFRLHSKDYYQKMLAVENIKLFFGLAPRSPSEGWGEYERKILCAGIFSFFGDTAVYLHGASSDENRELMAPYLLQWELIKKAKAAGCKYYDFSGIDEKKWPGITRFKRGFGGQEINYPGTFDVIFNSSKYSVYKFFRFVRRFF